MHELRKDPVLNRWAVALKDSKPPAFYLESAKSFIKDESDAGICILCPDRESETPIEIFSLRDTSPAHGSLKWHTRVIPRPNPIFQIEGDLGRKGIGMYDKMNGVGANEIIIESPDHATAPEDMGAAQMLRVISTYKNRMSELEKDPRLRYTLIYKDHGKTAGEIFRHPHSILYATPVIPKGIKDELDGAKAYYYYKERCIFCDIMNEELRTGERTIMETAGFIAFAPFASRFPFEYCIMPKRHSCAFQDMNNDEMEDLGLILTTTLKKMKKLLNDLPYNYVIHTAPNRVPRKDHWHTLGEDFHWHMEIMPRLITKSSFEWDSELYILTTSPEDAAKYFKEA
jgi:UDPglucose--hexose-1-phosphate uridylyltransferase